MEENPEKAGIVRHRQKSARIAMDTSAYGLASLLALEDGRVKPHFPKSFRRPFSGVGFREGYLSRCGRDAVGVWLIPLDRPAGRDKALI